MTRRGALVGAAGLYLAWAVATYLLEGRLQTLLRPEARGLRLTYALIANLLIGTVLSLRLARRLVVEGLVSARSFGFQSARRTAITVVAAAILGLAGYALQGAPTWRPVALLNGFAQVLVVSVAEVLVCWVIVGCTLRAALRSRGPVVAAGALLVVSAALFGAYHFAHSPPFDTPGMVLLLSGVGLLTGGFFLLSREVYGTIAFHTFLGLFGVLGALAEAGRLEALATPRGPLLATAIVAVATVALLDRLWLRPGSVRPDEGA